MLSEGSENDFEFSQLFSQLAVSPLFILMVVASIVYLRILRKDKGFWTNFGRVAAVVYIVIYLIALYIRFLYNG